MSKSRSDVQRMTMPAALKASLGPPPLLKYEDPRAYDALMAQVAARYAPNDVGWLVVKDYVDATWQFLRYSAYKVAIIDSEIESELDSILKVPKLSTTYETVEDELEKYKVKHTKHTMSDEEIKILKERRESLIEERRASPYFADGPRDYKAIYAQAFMNCIDNLNKLEPHLQSAQRRRDAALNQLERYRASDAAVRRAGSSEIIDGQFKDLSGANAPRKLKKSA